MIPSGEYLAIDVTESQVRTIAKQALAEVEKLKAALRAITQRFHTNYHLHDTDVERWEDCDRASCRETQAALGELHGTRLTSPP